MDDNEPLPEFWPVPSSSLNNEKANTESRFFKFRKRNFSFEENKKYRWVDIIFGLIWPILALILDPGLFRRGFFGESGLLGNYQLFVYTGIAISVFTLTIWLFFYQSLFKYSSLFAGIFLTGGFVAIGIQIIILPYALMAGIAGVSFLFSQPIELFRDGIWLIGMSIFGFFTILTAWVYMGNGMVARFEAKSLVSRQQYILALFLGAMIILAPSGIVQWRLNAMCTYNVKTILEIKPLQNKDTDAIMNAIKSLKFSRIICDQSIDEIVWEYSDEDDPARKLFLADTYFEITEEDIEHRLVRLRAGLD